MREWKDLQTREQNFAMNLAKIIISMFWFLISHFLLMCWQHEIQCLYNSLKNSQDAHWRSLSLIISSKNIFNFMENGNWRLSILFHGLLPSHLFHLNFDFSKVKHSAELITLFESKLNNSFTLQECPDSQRYFETIKSVCLLRFTFFQGDSGAFEQIWFIAPIYAIWIDLHFNEITL